MRLRNAPRLNHGSPWTRPQKIRSWQSRTFSPASTCLKSFAMSADLRSFLIMSALTSDHGARCFEIGPKWTSWKRSFIGKLQNRTLEQKYRGREKNIAIENAIANQRLSRVQRFGLTRPKLAPLLEASDGGRMGYEDGLAERERFERSLRFTPHCALQSV